MRLTVKNRVRKTKTFKSKGGAESEEEEEAFTGRCGQLEDYVPEDHGVEEEDCLEKLHYHKKKLLGRGGQGSAYSVREDKNAVIKITKIKTRLEKKLWYNEACISRILGDVKPVLAPKIFAFYECNLSGYIHMQILTTIDKITIDDEILVIRDHDTGGDPIDHIGLIPAEMQQGYINKFVQLTDLGYIHMDNHVGNLGLLKDKPILFDFGFVQTRTFPKKDKAWAIVFSLFIVLEHCPLDEIESTVFFTQITTLMNGGKPLKMAAFKKLFPCNPDATKKDISTVIANAKTLSETNLDLYVGSLMFASIISLEREERYNHPFYSKIYEIRQGKIVWIK